MDKQTKVKLNELNKEFYLKTQEYFNTTRQFNWAGWDKFLPYLPTGKAGLQGRTLKVLDVSCGNGRFGEFLIDKGKKIEYVGIDNNQYLLDVARKKLPKSKLINQDILRPIRLKADFDIVVLFGVLHHVPGKKTRLQLIKDLAKLMKKGGLLVLTSWHFNKLKRFNSYVIPWSKIGLKKEQVEAGDYLLDWKRGVMAYRYCHLMTESELKEIKTTLRMELVTEYVADAKSGQGNRYVILRKNR